MDDSLTLDGFEELITALEEVGSGPLELPGLEEPARPSAYVRMILKGSRERGLTFEEAWAAAINRLQPSQLGGVIEAPVAAALRVERAAIEDEQPIWRAAYEGRDMTPTERRVVVSASWHRYDGPCTGIGRRRRVRPE